MITARYQRLLRCTGLLLLAALLSGCPNKNGAAGNTGASDTKMLKVLCTTSIIADCARRIGGEHCEVTSLMGPGVDPHLYKAKESDLTALASADLVLYNGLHLEAKLADVLEQLGERRPCVAICDAIPEDRLLSWQGGGGSHDPHVWFDISLWQYCVKSLYEAIARADPAHSADYAANFETFNAEMTALDAQLRQDGVAIPQNQRVIITSHDAFRYFGRAYGFEVRGLQGISTQSEAGTGDVQELISFVVERRIPALFVESSVPRRSIEAVQEGCKARGWQVSIGGELLSDALGSPGTPGESYTGMLRYNMDTVIHALGQPAPEGGGEQDR